MVAVSGQEFSVKGTATLVTRDYVDERIESGWFTRVAREVEPKWPDRLLPGEGYPLRPQVHALRKALPKLRDHRSVEDLVVVLSGKTAEADLNSIYRAFLWAASPRMFLFAVPRIWATYCRFGTTDVLENQPGRFTAHVRGIPEDLLEWVAGAYRGFLPPALELAGGKQPKAQVRDRKRSEGADTWEMHYDLDYG